MSILITGCAGFIGSHAVEEFLNAGHEALGLDSMTYAAKLENMSGFLTNITFFKEDICDTEKVAEIVKVHDVECIINFAAETHVDNSIEACDSFIYSNILGVKSLLEVCKITGCWLLQVSTDEVYGSTAQGSFSEEAALNPGNPYSATKAAAEHLIRAYQNTYGIRYKIVRMSNNFGPRQHSEKFIPTILRSLAAGKKIPVYGNGKNIRDWFYVKDCVSMLRKVYELAPMDETFNLTLGSEKTNIEIVELILDILGDDPLDSIEFVEDRPGHDFRYSIDSTKVAAICDHYQTPLRQALSETINEQRSQI